MAAPLGHKLGLPFFGVANALSVTYVARLYAPLRLYMLTYSLYYTSHAVRLLLSSR